MPSRLLLIHNTVNDLQAIPFELNLRKTKWMFVLENLLSIADHYSRIYDNYILGDLNLEPNSIALTSIMQSFKLFNLNKPNTYFKGKDS